MERLRTYLRSFQLLSDEEVLAFEGMVSPKRLKKGDFLIKDGQISREAAFIVSGMFRSFYYSSKGEEITYCLTFQRSFITAYSSFITQQPTTENIHALSDVELLCVSREDFMQLEEQSVNWLRLSKILAQDEYMKMEQRIQMLQKENAETRYEHLLQNHPEYLREIPLNYLASYLGITQRHLSRIRAAYSN